MGPDGWIPCTERLPEMNALGGISEVVLTWPKGFAFRAPDGWHADGGGPWLGSDYRDAGISHWRPFPDGPLTGGHRCATSWKSWIG